MDLDCIMKDSGQLLGKTFPDEEDTDQLMEELWSCCHSNSSGTTGQTDILQDSCHS